MSRIAGYGNIMSIDYQMVSARWREAEDEKDALVNDLGGAVGRDRDETRRLLYMALYASRTNRYNLVGTLVNALAHHGSGIDPDEAADRVIAAADQYGPREEREPALAWVRAQIERLTAEEANPDSA
jgi:hypothetical protein